MSSAITVVYDQDISTLNVPDGVVVDVQTRAGAGGITPAQASAVAYAGTATWGVFDSVYAIGDQTTGLRLFGPQTVSPNDLMTFANAALALGVRDVRLVRIGDGTQVAAVLPLMGATAAFVNLIGRNAGSLINPATAVFSYSPLTPASMMTTTGNAKKVLVDLTIYLANGDSETYQNLDGNVATTVTGVTTYAIDPIALAAAVTAAVNAGIPNGRGASRYFIASAAASATPGAPIIGTPNVVMTPGTDGAQFATGAPKSLNAAMLGSNATLPATGMYAFGKQLSGAALSLCGCFDVETISGPMLAYCKGQNGHAIVSFALGTPASGASGSIARKNLLGLADSAISVLDGNFVEIVDSVNGAIHRFVDPSPLAAARFAITPPHISPANQSMKGVIVGTSQIGSLANSSYDSDEVLALENAGINFFSNDTAGSVGFAIRHNKNSLGKTAGYRGNIAYSRLNQFLVASYQTTILGQLAGQDQGFSRGDDKSRSTARGLFHDFLGALRDNRIIDAYQVTCDLTNNRPGLGQLRVDTKVSQNEIIDVIAVGLTSGVGVIVSITPTR